MNKTNKNQSVQKHPNGKSPVKKAPVAKARIVRNNGPRMKTYLPNGDIRIAHREYFADLLGSSVFAVNTFPINPGMPIMFPWLSQIAMNWESHEWEKLEFCFETSAPTSATGTVILTVDYDSSDGPPEYKSDAMTYRGAVRSAPWTDSCHRSQQGDLHKLKERFNRSGSTSTNQDIKLYDVGNLYACTQGQAGATAVGELYVDYVVVLKTPQTKTAPDSLSAIVSGTTALSASDLTGTSSTKFGDLPVSVTAASTMTCSARWEGLIEVNVTGTTLVGPLVVTGTAGQSQPVSFKVTAAGTAGMGFVLATFDQGENITITLTSAATVTATSFRFCAYNTELN